MNWRSVFAVPNLVTTSLSAGLGRYYKRKLDEEYNRTIGLRVDAPQHTDFRSDNAGFPIPPGMTEEDSVMRRVYLTLFGTPQDGGIPKQWSFNQERWLKNSVVSLLKGIYGTTYAANSGRVIRDYLLPAITSAELYSIIIAARREGKTTCISALIAALLVSMPKFVINVYSTGQRASTAMTDEVRQRLDEIGVPRERYAVNNDKAIALTSSSGVNIAHFFPDNPKVGHTI